jgi:Arc/MetJ-type ribon-helix-helix transcriptional regulator
MNYAQIVEICCRDLQRYLEYALKATRGGVVTVRMNRVMQVAPPPLDRKRFERCLSAVLSRWRWSTGVYVVPRRDAETLLSSFDELCAPVARNQRAAQHIDTATHLPPTAEHTPENADGKMVLITFHVPHALVQALDRYAQRKNATRADIIREAVQQLIEKYRGVEADLHRPTALAVPPIAQEELVYVGFPETRYIIELLSRYAAALQVARADVIRAAIKQLIDKMRAV